MKSRQDIIDFIVKLESKYNVDKWEVSGIKIWPWVRIKLYFQLHSSLEKNKREKVKNKEVLSEKSTGFKYVYQLLLFYLKLKKKKYLFVEGSIHRIEYENKDFNKFYDVLIDECNLTKEAYIFDYLPKKSSKELANPTLRFDIEAHFSAYYKIVKYVSKFYKSKVKENSLNHYDDFLTEISNIAVFQHKIPYDLLKENVVYRFIWFRKRVAFFKMIFKKIKIQELFMLCYYNNDITYSIITAANELHIKTTEMQHGAHGKIEVPYASWTNIPEEGYNLLPRNYWCWDQTSVSTLKSWTLENKLYNSYIGGNIWVDYLYAKETNLQETDFILYSLQSLSFDLLFPESIIKLIKESGYKWMVRMHPRQQKFKKDLILFLKQKEIYDFVNLEKGTSLPLPILLKNCLVNITHYSGTVNEAALMRKKTILLDKLGVECFPEHIENKTAFFIVPAELTPLELNKVISLNTNMRTKNTPFYLNYFS